MNLNIFKNINNKILKVKQVSNSSVHAHTKW